jgi:hypothetical protein
MAKMAMKTEAKKPAVKIEGEKRRNNRNGG